METHLINADILKSFGSVINLSEEDKKQIVSSFKSKNLKKGELLLQQGNQCKYVGFLKRGLVRYFVYQNGEASTFEFTKEGDFIADYSSLNRSSFSVQNIEAVEDCEILVIDKPTLDHLFQSINDGNYIGRIILEHRFDVMVNQLLAVYMQNSEERYLKFLEDYSDLSQRIPQYLIASYMGVQPPSLSRIRKRLADRS